MIIKYQKRNICEFIDTIDLSLDDNIIDVYVSDGEFNPPYYRFYLDSNLTTEITEFNVNMKYKLKEQIILQIIHFI